MPSLSEYHLIQMHQFVNSFKVNHYYSFGGQILSDVCCF